MSTCSLVPVPYSLILANYGGKNVARLHFKHNSHFGILEANFFLRNWKIQFREFTVRYVPEITYSLKLVRMWYYLKNSSAVLMLQLNSDNSLKRCNEFDANQVIFNRFISASCKALDSTGASSATFLSEAAASTQVGNANMCIEIRLTSQHTFLIVLPGKICLNIEPSFLVFP